MKQFDCSLCAGMCCVTPPALASIEEIEKAQNLGANLKYCKIDNKEHIFIAKKGNKCQFLDKDGNCSIYEDRFLTCKSFKCALLHKTTSYLTETDFGGVIEAVNTNTGEKIENLGIFEKGVADRFNIEEVSIPEAFQMSNMVDLATIIKLFSDTLYKIEGVSK